MCACQFQCKFDKMGAKETRTKGEKLANISAMRSKGYRTYQRLDVDKEQEINHNLEVTK